MITSAQKKLIEDTHKLAGNIKRLVPMVMKDYEKKLDKDDAEMFKKAIEITDLKGQIKTLADAEVDYNKFMKEYASKNK